jgi:hypothetical protein
LDFKLFAGLYLLILYFDVVHVPFAIQARWVVPVHIFILMLAAIGLGNLITRAGKPDRGAKMQYEGHQQSMLRIRD